MSDDELRALARAAIEGGDEAARMRAIAVAIRSGHEPIKWAQIAAHLGDSACRKVINFVPLKKKTRQKLRPWMWGLKPGGKEAFIRAGMAVIRRVYSIQNDSGRLRFPRADGIAAAIEAWTRCPCPKHEGSIEGYLASDFRGWPQRSMCIPCARACLSYSLPYVRRLISQVASHAVDELYEIYATGGGSHTELVAQAEEDLKAAITAELLPWALSKLL